MTLPDADCPRQPCRRRRCLAQATPVAVEAPGWRERWRIQPHGPPPADTRPPARGGNESRCRPVIGPAPHRDRSCRAPGSPDGRVRRSVKTATAACSGARTGQAHRPRRRAEYRSAPVGRRSPVERGSGQPKPHRAGSVDIGMFPPPGYAAPSFTAPSVSQDAAERQTRTGRGDFILRGPRHHRAAMTIPAVSSRRTRTGKPVVKASMKAGDSAGLNAPLIRILATRSSATWIGCRR